ncbi:MAG: O-antigen ligase family protein [Candidatus Falkowbacteria bacterium]
MSFSKTVYITLSAALLLSLLFLANNLDWSTGYFPPLAVIAVAAIFVLAALNFQNTVLFMVFILPAVYHFNYLKINILNYLPFLSNNTFYLNPASVIYLIIILLGLLTLIEKRHDLKSLPLKYIILAAVILAGVSIFWSANPQTSLIELIYLIVPFAMYLIAYFYFSNQTSFAKLLLVSVLSSIIPLIVAIFQLATNSYFYEPDSSLGRLIGTLDHPNTFGLFLFLITGLLIALYLAKANRSFKNNKLIFFYLAGLLFFFALTYSRTSWLCFAVFIILLIFLERKIIWLILASLPLAAIIFLAFENIRYRILEIFDSAIFSSITARLNIWQVSFEQVLIKPFFGHGVGAAESVIEKAKPWQGGISLPHNDYLLQILELGLAGLAIFLIYTFGAIYYVFKTFKSLADKKTVINLYGRVFILNFKVLAFGLLAILIALLPATIFESLSQKIILQTIIWSLLGGLFGLLAGRQA